MALVFSALLVAALASTAVLAEEDNIPPRTPWTGGEFLNDPDNFQFAVIGERTGSHRPGVFADAMQRINLLRPLFVVGVGDLVEGYVTDEQALQAQWRELDGLVTSLDMPFFYTVGNHDLSNPEMADYWRRHKGRDYYRFVYEDVLLLSLNTEDPPVELSSEELARTRRFEQMMRNDPEGTQQRILDSVRARGAPKKPGHMAISDDQVSYVAQVLAQYPDVRGLWC